MSNFIKNTLRPDTQRWEFAHWMDNHFEHHHYGVQFLDGTILDPQQVKLETNNEPCPDEILAQFWGQEYVDHKNGVEEIKVSNPTPLEDAAIPLDKDAEARFNDLFIGFNSAYANENLYEVEHPIKQFIASEKERSRREGEEALREKLLEIAKGSLGGHSFTSEPINIAKNLLEALTPTQHTTEEL